MVKKHKNNMTGNVLYNELLTGVRIAIVSVERQIRITYFQCVFVALVHQCDAPQFIALCGLSGSTMNFHMIS